MATQTYLSVAAFANEGYLQELNRVFLHPLGLALSWHPEGHTYESFKKAMEEAGYQYGEDAMQNAWAGACLMGADKPRLGAIWDGRDDPEGWIFGWDDIDDTMKDKADNVSREWEARKEERVKRLGFLVQNLNAQVITPEGIEQLLEDTLVNGQPPEDSVQG